MTKLPALFQIKKELQAFNAKKKVKVVVLRNFTLEPFESYLSYLGMKDKYQINLCYSDIDNVFQTILDGSLFTDARLVFYFFSLEHSIRGFPYKHLSSTDQELKELEAELIEDVVKNISLFREKTNIPLVLFLPSSSGLTLDGFLGELSGKLNTASRIREKLVSELSDVPNIYFEDLARVALRSGEAQILEKERNFTTSSLYNLEGLGALAKQSFRYVRAIMGGTKKVVVLDCDNTLWGGVIGEDGLAGIYLGDEGKGKAYKALQHYFMSLSERGVLLCIASKNNEADVWEVFDNHTDMVLTRKHVVNWRINWDAKAENIKEMAKDLNLNLDSFVFVDDSDYELGLVRERLPEVCCVKCEHDYPLGAVEQIVEQGYFDVFSVTDEDRKRVELYRSELSRNQKRKAIVNIDDYLKELNIELFISSKVEKVWDRLSQLTLRTNQFNLTTQRYDRPALQELVTNPNNLTLYISAADKFGDLGIIGLASATISNTNAVIGLFLMSCRAMGRKIETVLLEKMVEQLKYKGVRYVEARYIKTLKNAVVAEFYENHQFLVLEESEGSKKYALNIGSAAPSGAQNLFRINEDY